MEEISKGDSDKETKTQEGSEKMEIISENGSETSSSSSFNAKGEFVIPASACASRTASSNSDGDKTEKILKILQFKNPGPQYSSFNPDKSRREQRKVKQLFSSTQTTLSPEQYGSDEKKKEKKETKPRNPPKRRNYHDKYGIRLLDNKDVCDCQNLDCPGCHFPCSSCSSEKCGVECRCSRRWTYEDFVEIENPYESGQNFGAF